MYLEQVQFYKYLGSTVNSDNSIEEEIQYRIIIIGSTALGGPWPPLEVS
jgi:CHASE2 domain-containing sensor protein